MRTVFIENKKEIEAVIKACKTCYLGMSVNDKPYVLPMNFAIDGETVILHSATEGRMWESIQQNPQVSINWTLGEELAWQNARVGCSYRVKSKSVIVEGKVEVIEDYEEKYRCLKILMSQYSDREFKFGKPSVKNVGVLKVHIEEISAKEFGAKAVTSWNG